MKQSIFESRLIKQIYDQLPGAAPGVMVQAYQNGRKLCDISVGDTFAYYDLASLTKIIFTTQAMMRAFNEGRWHIETKVKNLLAWFPSEHTTVIQLLNHTSGMEWWQPLYQEIDVNAPMAERWLKLQQLLQKSKIAPGDPPAVYSDLGFMVMAFILEKLYERPLLQVWQEIKEQFYPRLSLEFHPENQPPQPVRFYAPTEKCPWRGRVMQGEVHDENCWALGGVSTHAGLFGSVDDVGWFGLFVRGQLQGISRTLIKQKTAQLFASRSLSPQRGDWALGYMMPTPGHSSTGDYFSPHSIGHTGFTGTSFWYDPAQDLIVVILSNRLAFGREIVEFKKLRPQIHNWIVEGLRRIS